ncbi:hypothetical protein ACFQ3W_01080 [Paenibacillus puldeungensis]|uniref:Uncharacterized protein n=1 Tax=Paenibacillus puldeungensis TaxID=696536 RepID=A0ABW3RS63_9BACL
MNDKVKGILIGAMIGTMLTGATAFAATGVNINVVAKKLAIYMDGAKKTSADAFIYKGTTYVPIKSTGTAIGKQVGLYGDNLYIGKQPSPKVTAAQAMKLVDDKYGPFAPVYTVEVDHETQTTYTVHVYEAVIDDPATGVGHTATFNWYDVDKFTGKITPMF